MCRFFGVFAATLLTVMAMNAQAAGVSPVASGSEAPAVAPGSGAPLTAPGSGTPITSGIKVPVPYHGIPGPQLTEPTQDPSASSSSDNFVNATLIDGTRVEFDANGVVQVVAKDGSKTPAPDGMLTLKDGTPFVVKDGRRVSEY